MSACVSVVRRRATLVAAEYQSVERVVPCINAKWSRLSPRTSRQQALKSTAAFEQKKQNIIINNNNNKNNYEMDLCNKVLSKTAISWPDVQKQLITLLHSRNAGTITTSSSSSGGINNPSYASSSSHSSLAINRPFVRQCTDYLIKHIKSKSSYKVIFLVCLLMCIYKT